MKRILLPLALCGLLSNLAYAEVYMGAQGGFTHTSNELNGNDSVGAGVILGFETPVASFVKLGISTELNYATKAVNINNDKSGILTIPLYATANFKLPLNLNLTAKLGYGFNYFGGMSSQNFPSTLWRPVTAVSLGYQIKNMNIFFQSSRYFLDHGGQSPYFDFYSFGVLYTLPQ